MHHVYILISEKDRSKIYIGISESLGKRILEHNQSKSSYSKKYAPWQLETFISFHDERLAHAFERYLKKGSGFAFLKKRLLPK